LIWYFGTMITNLGATSHPASPDPLARDGARLPA